MSPIVVVPRERTGTRARVSGIVSGDAASCASSGVLGLVTDLFWQEVAGVQVLEARQHLDGGDHVDGRAHVMDAHDRARGRGEVGNCRMGCRLSTTGGLAGDGAEEVLA